jgi:UDP-N-acetylglucosamine diphosphorylase / glucose-1-phosphate thymidylyltransferase / UDP-N-acetylgalactosamine diphosphorylase / glucosamine-1-phosphate N-acetyltransferase / galactosamine-1-phosphate N-acetyltransferase
MLLPVLSSFIECADRLPEWMRRHNMPWDLTGRLDELLGPVADIEPSAIVAPTAVLEGRVRIGARSSIGPGTVLRGGVWIDDDVRIGPNCEVKASVVFCRSAIAHLSYVGNSILGQDVNLEAGVVLANHWNERDGEEISVLYGGQRVATGVHKFGALVGDGARIGANAVTSPGTLLAPGAVVPRLALVDQSEP